LQGENIPPQREGDDIRPQSIQHRMGLLARSTVRLLDGNGLARLSLVSGDEERIDVFIQLARRVVRNVEQMHFLSTNVRAAEHDHHEGNRTDGDREFEPDFSRFQHVAPVSFPAKDICLATVRQINIL
jgi:hypothetical protein